MARIKLIALLLHALCAAQIASLHKLECAIPTEVDKDTCIRRIQQSFAKNDLDLYTFDHMIFSLLPVKTKLVLSIDRTNWKFGELNINIRMLGVTYKGIAFPLILNILPNRDNSNLDERKKIMEQPIRLFGQDCIDWLVADRELIGKECIGWLNSRRIRHYLGIRHTSGLSGLPLVSRHMHGALQ